MERIVDRIGPLLMAAGLALVGAVELWHGTLDAIWRPAPVGMEDTASWPRIDGALLLATAGAWMIDRFRQIAASVAALLTATPLFSHINALIAAPIEPTTWVGPLEAAALGAVWFALWARSPRSWLAARVVVGLMLVAFGLVHLLEREAIAGLIPAWMPGRAVWPYLTATANLLAGAALISGVAWRPVAALVGLMFASWIVLVHASRLFADPFSAFEQAFAATALMLVGVVWTLLRPRGGSVANLSFA